MKLGISTNLKTEQRLALMPRLLQSIEILQMSNLELLDRISAEVEGNETLEVQVPEAEVPSLDQPEPLPEAEDRPPDLRATADEAGDDKLAFLANQPERELDLFAFLRLQMSVLGLSESTQAAVLVLAAELDERGLLTQADASLIRLVGEARFEPALRVLRQLEPRGIGGRDMVDAMLLQLPPGDPDTSAIRDLLGQHLTALAENRLPAVAKALQLPLNELEDLLQRVRRLDPSPLRRFTLRPAAAIRPDAVVRLVDGEILVEIDNLTLPDLGISSDYRGMLQDPSLAKVAAGYLRGKLQAATDLIEAVEQRKRTLARVVATVMQFQRGFLEKGRVGLRPLQMHTIAAQLQLHPSTISRAIAGKFLQTNWGIVALREFFDGSRRDAAGDAEGSGRSAIRETIRSAVAAEDPRQPLSDEALQGQLETHGVRVARRTVAKYRAELGIPPSHRRRRHG